MSKDKIHIDKLFQKLKDHQPEVSASDWDAVNNKLADSAWKEKFANYEPKVEDDDFPFVPHPVSDNKPGQRKSILLALLLLLLVSVSLVISIPLLKKDKPLSNSQPVKENKESKIDDEIQKSSVLAEMEDIDVLEAEVSRSMSASMGADFDSKIHSNADKSESNKPSIGENVSAKQFDDDADVSKEVNSKQAEPNSNSASTKDEESATNDNNKGDNSEATDITTVSDDTEKILQVELVETESNEAIEDEIAEEEPQGAVLEDSSKNESKRKMKLHVNFGSGLLSSTTDLGNLQGNSAARYFAHIGADFGKIGIVSGIQHQPFSFRTEEMRVMIYDSFPHLNMRGDTIGWFKRNQRDTSKKVDLDSRVDVISIPVGFSVRLLKYRKSSLYILGMGTCNIFRNRGIYGLDDDNYTKAYAPEEDIIHKSSLGYSIELKYGYAIRPRWMLTLNCAYFNTQNISKSSSFEVQPMGYSLNVGLNYQLR